MCKLFWSKSSPYLAKLIKQTKQLKPSNAGPVKKYLMKNGYKWLFNPPHAQHTGNEKTHCLESQAECSNASSAQPTFSLNKSTCFLNCDIASNGAEAWKLRRQICRIQHHLCLKNTLLVLNFMGFWWDSISWGFSFATLTSIKHEKGASNFVV